MAFIENEGPVTTEVKGARDVITKLVLFCICISVMLRL